MPNTVNVVDIGHVPQARGAWDGSRYYKDNIVQYQGSAYIASPPDYDPVTNPEAYITTAPWTTDPHTLNPGWSVFSSGNNTFTTGERVDEIGVDDTPESESDNLIKSRGVHNELALGAVYDVSAKNPTAGPNNDGKFTLEYILNNANSLIPESYRKGGMSIKFVQSSDNKYVQFRYMSDDADTIATFTNIANWQGVDEELKAGSINLAESRAVMSSLQDNEAIELKGSAGTVNHKLKKGNVYLIQSLRSNDVTATFKYEGITVVSQNFSQNLIVRIDLVTLDTDIDSITFGDAYDVIIAMVGGAYYYNIRNPYCTKSGDESDLTIVTGKYINTGVNVGDLISLTPIAAPSQTAYTIVECRKFDKFVISTLGGSSSRGCCFIDKDNKCVFVIGPGAEVFKKEYISPCDGKLIVNTVNETSNPIEIDYDIACTIDDVVGNTAFASGEKVSQITIDNSLNGSGIPKTEIVKEEVSTVEMQEKLRDTKVVIINSSSATSNTTVKLQSGKTYYFFKTDNRDPKTITLLSSGVTKETFNIFFSEIVTLADDIDTVRVSGVATIEIIEKENILYQISRNPYYSINKDYGGQIVTGAYIDTSGNVGTTVDIIPVSASSAQHIIIPCRKLDVFHVTGQGGSSSRAWCFTDINYKKLASSGAGIAIDSDIVSNQDGYLIANTSDRTNHPLQVRGVSVSLTIEDLFELVPDISNYYTKLEINDILDDLDVRLFTRAYSFTYPGDVNKAYSTKNGRKYVVINTANKTVTFTTRVSEDSSEYVDSKNCNPLDRVVFTASGDANYIRVNDTASIIIYDLSSLYGQIENIKAENGEFDRYKASVDFAFEKDMEDVSTEVASVDFGETESGCYTIMEQIYDKFDSLVSDYPDYITKVDIAQELDLSYPQYASLDGQASGDYLATPTYKTYMYKLVSYNQYVNTDLQKKKKIFLIGATHGDEVAAPFNLYLIAKRLCEATHEDYFKLRAVFDFYIIPCLNGYGLYHRTRVNANGVNINRNYPTKGWSVAGAGTEDYTGATAGSEFETQIVMGVVDSYKPNMLIDHHNYARIAWQFYSEVCEDKLLHIVHKSLVDCSCTFIKNLPTYFGNSYKLFQENNESAPGQMATTFAKTTARWGYEVGVPFSATIEISCTINYTNGVYDNDTVDRYYSPDVFKVGEFTLRNQLLHYGKYIIG